MSEIQDWPQLSFGYLASGTLGFIAVQCMELGHTDSYPFSMPPSIQPGYIQTVVVSDFFYSGMTTCLIHSLIHLSCCSFVTLVETPVSPLLLVPTLTPTVPYHVACLNNDFQVTTEEFSKRCPVR